MLALQQHFSVCPSCEAEMRSIRHLKRLLRSLHEPRLQTGLPDAIHARLAQADAPVAFWTVLFPLAASTESADRPQRGRRLVNALALSCLAVLTLSAPFAPASQDGVLTASMLGLPRALPVPASAANLPAQPGPLLLTAMLPADVRPSEFFILTDTDNARRERAFAGQYAQPFSLDILAAPLNSGSSDDAVRGYVQGDVAFAGYRTR